MIDAEETLLIWEHGQDQDALRRALILLAFLEPEGDGASLSAWTLGERDYRLMGLLAQLNSGNVRGQTACPKCNTSLAFDLNLSQLQRGDYHQRKQGRYNFNEDGVQLSFRLPDSTDLEAAARYPDAETAREILILRCITAAHWDGVAVDPLSLPHEVIARVGDAVAETDPHQETLIALTCANCEHTWRADFDAATFLWQEIEARAKRILNEVEILARGYGWSEEAILNMTAVRRNAYMENLVNHE